MRFTVTKRFTDKFTGVCYRLGSTYETTDEERAKFLQRGRYIGAEAPAEDVPEAPVAEDVPAEVVQDDDPGEGAAPEAPAEDVPETPVVTVDELADMSRAQLDEVAPLFITDYDPAAFKNKGAVREAIEKVMAEGA